MADTLYKIVRFKFDEPNEVVRTGLTREEAEAHCSREDTRGDGWFDGFDVQNPTDEELQQRAEKDATLLDAARTLDRLIGGGDAA